jgi:pentatricopeptide repeat protein
VLLSDVSLAFGLKACASLGVVDEGLRRLHTEIVTRGLEAAEGLVGNALVDACAKCGLIAEAQGVFDRLSARDRVSWNSLAAGYAMMLGGNNGNGGNVSDILWETELVPDRLTFASALNACSHEGLADGAQLCLEAMVGKYGYVPTLEHYTALVDLYARQGNLEKAVEIVRRMPLCPDAVVWHVVLVAGRRAGCLDLATLAFEHALGLDQSSAAAYVSMSNAYADVG